MDYYVPLLPNKIYHVVSRAVGSEKLFLHQENYRFFLERYEKYISPVAATFAFALLPNHFHFLIQVRSPEILLEQYKRLYPEKTPPDGWQPVLVMRQFSNMLNSYVKSFNKVYHRKGSLLMDYMRRVEVMDERQFTATAFYIHKNPVHHGYCLQLNQWRWTSYKAILSDTPTKLERDKLLEWFGGKKCFVDYHSREIHLKWAAAVEYP